LRDHQPKSRLAIRGDDSAGILPPKAGVGDVNSVVVSDAVRQFDFREREMAFVAKAPRQIVDEVLDKLLTVLEED
jgi:hypothetical protein